MITGTPNPTAPLGEYKDLHAVHIFPYAREVDWRAGNFQRFITDNSVPAMIGSDKIHSPQNGMLITAGHHAKFDSFEISINPDVSYSRYPRNYKPLF
jgi:hypothetical protein